MSCAVLAACNQAESPSERSDTSTFGTGAAGTGADGVNNNNQPGAGTQSTMPDRSDTLPDSSTQSTMPPATGAGAGTDGYDPNSSTQSTTPGTSTGTTSGSSSDSESNSTLD